MSNEGLNPERYYSIIHNYREGEIFLAAIRLNIFTYLDRAINAEEISILSGYNKRNLELFLNALASMKIIKKDNKRYENTRESSMYLSKQSKVYLGECFLFRENMSSLSSVEDLVRFGPNEKTLINNNQNKVYDFLELARVSMPEMYTGRISGLLKSIEELYPNNYPRKFLDIGGGSGLMSIEIAKSYRESKGIVFESPDVASLPKELIYEEGLGDRLSVIEGNFVTDDIGNNYDLIIASGVIEFAKGDLNGFIKKLYNSLERDGYLYVISQKVSEDYLEPTSTILAWLSSHLEGLDLLLPYKTIESVLYETGFTLLLTRKNGLFLESIYKK